MWVQPLAGKIPWRRPWQPTPVFLPGEPHPEKPGGLQSIRSQRVRNNWSNLAGMHTKKIVANTQQIQVLLFETFWIFKKTFPLCGWLNPRMQSPWIHSPCLSSMDQGCLTRLWFRMLAMGCTDPQLAEAPPKLSEYILFVKHCCKGSTSLLSFPLYSLISLPPSWPLPCPWIVSHHALINPGLFL